MKEDDKYFYWTKGEKLKLSDNFNTKDFTCHCTHPECIEQKISKTLIAKLQKYRVKIKKAVIITSGYRCIFHQKDIALDEHNTVVAKISQHEYGNAADLFVKGMSGKQQEAEAKEFFEAIGIAVSFIHVDERTGKIRRWVY